jgi:divalent metal cation (Fe/Co/Zn/Cd) transporter
LTSVKDALVAYLLGTCNALRQPMLNPLKWKYESQVGLLVSTIAGAGFGILIGYRSENGLLGTLIWALIGAVILGGAFYFGRAAYEG